MKKFFKFMLVPLLMVEGLLTSCNNVNADTNIIINKYIESNSLSFTNSITVDSSLAVSKTSYFSYDNSLKGYSLINRYGSKLFSREKEVKEYVEGSLIYYVENNVNDGILKEYDSDNIASYVGLDSVFTNASKKSIRNNSIKGSIDSSLCFGILKSIIYDCGYYDENYENYSFKNTIDYTIYFNKSNDSIMSINLDITDVLKLKDSTITSASSNYVFSQEDVNVVLSNNPFPSLESNNNVDYSIVNKSKGIEYIKDCYSDIKYVCDDLYFYTNSIISPKLSFSYTSNKPDVISNTGKYSAVETDTEVTITVDLMYSSVKYSTYSFSFFAVPKTEDGEGKLGSISNPLYKGRKEINEVKINFIEMHQQYGDSIYIQAGDFDMLIDAGTSTDGGYVNDFLRRNVSDGRIEMLIATHAHSDHIGGMLTALSTFPNVSYAVDYGYEKSDYSLVSNVRNKFKQADNYYPITDCIDNINGASDTIYITNDFYITFLDTGYYQKPSKDYVGNDDYNANLTSVALLMTFKNQKYYFAGDLETSGENNIVNQVSKVSIAKASHHGSTTSNSKNLLSKLQPNISVISTALVDRGSTSSDAKNQTHPIGKALKTISTYSSKVYCNFTTGTLQITCDGNSKLDVKGLGLSSPYYMNGKAVSGEDNLEFKYTKYAKAYRSNFI